MPRIARYGRRARLGARAALLVLGPWSLASPAHAGPPDLNQRALQWLRGRWASPIVCESNGDAHRTLRRLVISSGPRHDRPATDRLAFFGVEVEAASRCNDAMGVAAPDVRGSLFLTLPSISRPDLAQSDFQRALRQSGGFDFDVVSGRLRLTGWGEAAEPRIVDFAGGTVRARVVRRGSDAARILADLEGPRKLTLEVESPDGAVTLSFHVVFYGFR